MQPCHLPKSYYNIMETFENVQIVWTSTLSSSRPAYLANCWFIIYRYLVGHRTKQCLTRCPLLAVVTVMHGKHSRACRPWCPSWVGRYGYSTNHHRGHVRPITHIISLDASVFHRLSEHLCISAPLWSSVLRFWRAVECVEGTPSSSPSSLGQLIPLHRIVLRPGIDWYPNFPPVHLCEISMPCCHSLNARLIVRFMFSSSPPSVVLTSDHSRPVDLATCFMHTWVFIFVMDGTVLRVHHMKADATAKSSHTPLLQTTTRNHDGVNLVACIVVVMAT